MKNKWLMILISGLIFSACTSVQKGNDTKSKKNFSMTIYDADIESPDQDRHCYYVIYIDKIESGRTNTGLESQKKYYEEYLIPNRHLIKIEKWLLNVNLGRYIKLNNIDQPKPDYIYVNIEKNKTVRVTVKSSKSGIASFSIIEK